MLHAVNPSRQGSFAQVTGVSPQPHGPPFALNLALLLHDMNNRVFRFTMKLRRMRILDLTGMTGIFDNRHLHSQADTKERNLLLAGIADGGNLALAATLPESTRHQDALHIVKTVIQTMALE